MYQIDYLTIALILTGALILGLAIRQTLKILNLLDEKVSKKGWRNLFRLMIFFLLGYVAAAYIVLVGEKDILQLLTGVIFFFGAVFVLIVVILGLKTMQTLKDARDDQQEKVALLKTQYDQLKQFSYATSHDLKEPINTVVNSLAIIKRDHGEKLTDSGNVFLGYAEKASGRMAELVDSLSEYIKLGTNLKKEEVALNALVNEVLAELNGAINSSNAYIKALDLPTISADKTELKRVFQNIIGNAIKYRKKNVDPEIMVYSQQKEPGYWTFSVQDNGIGINDQDFSKVFQLFRRIDKDQSEGLGIGMAITKKVVELHGGSIWLESEEGVGTSFHFTLKQ